MFTVLHAAPEGTEADCFLLAPRGGDAPSLVQTREALPIGRAYFNELNALHDNGDGHTGPKHNKSGAKEEELIVIPNNITSDNLDKFSLYDVLGLGKNTSAGIETIKKAYHKAVLLYHPDKKVSATSNGDEDRSIFLKIQLAFNTLCDEGKRRSYDSQLDFDDDIPSPDEIKLAISEGPKAYCDLFRPVFDRNSRFAVVKPVPSFGDEHTHINDVNRFYSYWVKFDSWRDFSTVDMEHKPDEASSREEKRWMIKENAVVARKLKKREMTRINDLVMSALENDPRILADKEAQKKAKENAKLARQAEAERIAAEEAVSKQREIQAVEQEKEAAKLLKEEKDRIKKLHGKYRSAFRKALRTIAAEAGNSANSEYGDFAFDDIEVVCANATSEELYSLAEGLGADMSSMQLNQSDPPAPVPLEIGLQRVREHVVKYCAEIHEAAEREAAAKAAARKEQLERAEADRKKKGVPDREWTRDDLSMLSKCLSKFPAGTPNRWDAISNYLNAQLKPAVPFEKSEVMRSAQNAMQFLAAKLKGHPNPSEVIAPAPPAAVPARAEPAPPAPPAMSPKVKVPIASPALSKPPAATLNPSAVASISKADLVANSNSSYRATWTQEQQSLLELGLRKHPSGSTPESKAERWKLIAAEIPGKTASDCIARYKYLREQVQAKTSSKK